MTGQQAADVIYNNDKIGEAANIGVQTVYGVFDNPAAFESAEKDLARVIYKIEIEGQPTPNVEYFLESLGGYAATSSTRILRITRTTNGADKITVLTTNLPAQVSGVLERFIDGKNWRIYYDWTGYTTTTTTVYNRVNYAGNKLSRFIFSDIRTVIEQARTQANITNNNLLEFENAITEKTLSEKYVNTLNGAATVVYGNSAIMGWGFCIGVHKNIKGFSWPGMISAGVTKIRAIIRKNSSSGEILKDQTFTYVGSNNFNFDTPIANADGGRLYFVILADAQIQVRRTNDTTIFTEANGYATYGFTTDANLINVENYPPFQTNNSYLDISLDILDEVQEYKIRPEVLPGGQAAGEAIVGLEKNYRISAAGSSVTWGVGFLESGVLGGLVPLLQKKYTDFKGSDDVQYSGGTYSVLQGSNQILLFGGRATRVMGVGATVEFDIDGDEVSIVQSIARDNSNASDIEVYVDDVLYDTFDNFNPEPIGDEVKTFTAVQGQKEFMLDRPFTFGHSLKVNGVATTITLVTTSNMPATGWGVARDIKTVEGQAIVQHTAFSPTALNAGDVVEISYSYGQELTYAKTTIGKTAGGTLENQYGRGYTAFDPANPGTASFGSGLDFRETDERVIKKYTFTEKKKRNIRLKIKGLSVKATGTGGTPYFIFNFATNRILYFQNAGIGGWKSSQFDDPTNSNSNILRTWREIVDFQPDIIFYESTPNDDWGVGGYKLYTVNAGLTLEQLQNIRTLPNKRINYDNPTYTYERWAGKIQSIDKYGLTLSADTLISVAPIEGDSVVIGTYYSDNKQQVNRLVRSYDAATKRVTFDRPIQDRDHVYKDLSYFIGAEVQIRNLAEYTNPTRSLIDKLKGYGNDAPIGLVPNPAPNMLSRDLAAYWPLLQNMGNEEGLFFVPMKNVYDWQYSQPRNVSATVNASALVTQPDGTKRIDLTGFASATNYLNFKVEVDGVDVTNEDAVVLTGYCLGVDRTLTGAALNDTATRGKQVWGNFRPTLVFLKNAPTSGTITVKASSNVWSADSCHVNTNSIALFALGYNKELKL